MKATLLRAVQILAVGIALSTFGVGMHQAYAAGRPALKRTECDWQTICFIAGQGGCNFCCQQENYPYGVCLSGGACLCGT
jgi:hypothetical protein